MTKKVNFCLPRLGGNESDARVIAWKKDPGEAFKRDEVLLEVETDKAVVEVPAPYDGVMVGHLKAVDEIAEFDEPLAQIEVQGEAAAEEQARAEEVEPAARAAAAPAPVTPAAPARPGRAPGRRAASPVARRYAAEHGIDLAGMPGSGKAGRVVLRDVAAGVAPTAAGAADRQVPQERRVPTRRGEVFVRQWNSANRADATLVLVHGLFGDVDTWAGLASGLADAGMPVVAVDLPLHGRSSVVALTIEEMADALAQVLASVAPGRKRLVGHSVGGAVAVKLARLSSVRAVEELVLIAPAGLGTEINQGFLDGMVNAGSLPVLRRELEKLATRLPAFGTAFLDDLLDSLRARPPDLRELTARLSVRGVQQIDIRQDLEQLRLPVSIFWGRSDLIVPWEHALNATARVALHLIPGVGHMPHWENSKLLLEALTQS